MRNKKLETVRCNNYIWEDFSQVTPIKFWFADLPADTRMELDGDPTVGSLSSSFDNTHFKQAALPVRPLLAAPSMLCKSDSGRRLILFALYFETRYLFGSLCTSRPVDIVMKSKSFCCWQGWHRPALNYFPPYDRTVTNHSQKFSKPSKWLVRCFLPSVKDDRLKANGMAWTMGLLRCHWSCFPPAACHAITQKPVHSL